jgi:hypothetical protein
VTARHEALDYIRAHKGQYVVVVAARIGRIWNVFRPWQNASFDGIVEGRGLAQARVALFAFYLYAAGAIVGLVALRRRRHPIWPYLVLAGVATFTVAISFAIQRYRSGRRGDARARGVGRHLLRTVASPQRTAEYDMSFVHLCVAPMMRIVPDFERITRLCVLAPSPQ